MKYLIDPKAPWIPSPEDEMLLMAALAPAGKAHDAGLAWLANVNLATQSEASNRLLPLVHDRMLRDGVDHPAMAILRGVRRKVWSRNHLLFKHVTPVIVALRQAGIDVMLLKGAALTLSYYQDYGLRPMGDIDVMVRVSDVSAVVTILNEYGWKSELPKHVIVRHNILRYAQEEQFKDSSGLELDLHWHLAPVCLDPAADFSFWEDSIITKFDSVDVCLLNPADQLLHNCLHGLIWSNTPSIRWISDSLGIIHKSPELDWNRLLLQTRNRNLTLFVRSALNYLVDRFDAPVPCDVLKEMNIIGVTSHDAREFTAFTERRSYETPALANHFSIQKTIQILFYSYERIATDAKLNGYDVTIREYLCGSYRKENVWQLLSYLVYGLGRRTLRSMRRAIMWICPASN